MKRSDCFGNGATTVEAEPAADSADPLWDSVNKKVEERAPSRTIALLPELPKAELVFVAGGTDAIVDQIKAIAKQKAAGLSVLNPKDRKELASIAYQVARSATLLDDAGKNLKKARMAGIDVLDAERKRCREALEEFQEEVRKPLTDFENANKARIKTHYDALAEIGALNFGDHRETVESLSEKLERLTEIRGRNWDEFAEAAKADLDAVESNLNTRIASAVKAREEATELAQLRREAAERARADREKRIADEAAEKARIASEEKAKRDAEEIAKAVERAAMIEREKTAKAERDAAAKEAARIAAEERAKQAELRAQADREESERQTERARKHAVEFAERKAREAVEAERKRADDERLAKAKEEAMRAANDATRKQVQSEAIQALTSILDSRSAAAKVVQAIHRGDVPNVRIEY